MVRSVKNMFPLRHFNLYIICIYCIFLISRCFCWPGPKPDPAASLSQSWYQKHLSLSQTGQRASSLQVSPQSLTLGPDCDAWFEPLLSARCPAGSWASNSSFRGSPEAPSTPTCFTVPASPQHDAASAMFHSEEDMLRSLENLWKNNIILLKHEIRCVGLSDIILVK